ncbi:MAG: hypothetical protein EBY57_07695 [Actinobacteria bacterium]|nr:hypothetical protein [Actinomycetota bacterium]
MMKRASDTEIAEAEVTGVALIPHSSQSICCIPIDRPLDLSSQRFGSLPIENPRQMSLFSFSRYRQRLRSRE